MLQKHWVSSLTPLVLFIRFSVWYIIAILITHTQIHSDPHICDLAPLNEACGREYQKSRIIIPCNSAHFDAKCLISRS